MGFDTPQDFVKRGIYARRTLFCRVSDLAEQMSAIKCTQLCHCSAGSDTPTRLSCVGSDTPQDLVLRGLIPRSILICGVSDPVGKLRPRRTRQKGFASLPFSLKGHFSKIICMHKLHYPRPIGNMLKGTVSQDFLCSVFSVKQLFLVPIGMPRNDFKIF